MSHGHLARRWSLAMAGLWPLVESCSSETQIDDTDVTAEEQLVHDGTQLGRGAPFELVWPVPECLDLLGNGHAIVHFGYENQGRRTLTIPIGRHNFVWPALHVLGQPTRFEPGLHHDAIQVEVLRYPYGTIWTLGGHVAQLSRRAPICGSPCGNGRVDCDRSLPGTLSCEQCDDGNAIAGDGCSAACTIEPGWVCGTAAQPCHQAYCGNGIVETYIDNSGNAQIEQCDDGNKIDTDACRDNCIAARCGDGAIQSGVEACDDGTQEDADGCSRDCTAITGGWSCPTPGQSCCISQCVLNQTECVNGRVRVCQIDQAGCDVWGEFANCPYGGKCIDASCEPITPEPSIIIDGTTTATLDGRHIIDGDLIIQNGSILTVPSGQLFVKANHVVLDSTSSIVVKPTGRDSRGQGDIARTFSVYYCANCYCSASVTLGGAGFGSCGLPSSASGVPTGMCSTCPSAPVTCPTEHNQTGAIYGIADDEIATGAAGGDGQPGGGYVAILADVIQASGPISALPQSSLGSGGMIYLRAKNELVTTSELRTTTLNTTSGSSSNCPEQPSPTPPSSPIPGFGGRGVIKLLYGGHSQPIRSPHCSGPVNTWCFGVPYESTMPPNDITSPSHPDPNRAYNDGCSMVSFVWSKPFSDAVGYYIAINGTYRFVPTSANGLFQTTEGTQAQVSDLSSGTNYLHVVTVGPNGDIGTMESRYSVRINSETPAISSMTHPDPDAWYTTRIAQLAWTMPTSLPISDTTRLYWSVDHDYDTVPTYNDNVIVVNQANPTAALSIELPSLADGIWFFHLVTEDTMGCLTKAAGRFRLQIGTAPENGALPGTREARTLGQQHAGP
jgi:cysteine-rich repeat protein